MDTLTFDLWRLYKLVGERHTISIDSDSAHREESIVFRKITVFYTASMIFDIYQHMGIQHMLILDLLELFH